MNYFIGVDIGGTNIRACVIDEGNNIVDKFKIKNEVSEGPTKNIDNLNIKLAASLYNGFFLLSIHNTCSTKWE